MRRILSRMNVPLILPVLLWLIVSPCQAFQFSPYLRSLETKRLPGFSGCVTRLHSSDESFNGNLNQTAPPSSLSNNHNPLDGNIANGLPTLLSSLSDTLGRFRKYCPKSLSSLVYGFGYEYRHILPATLWQANVPAILCNLFVFFLKWLEHWSAIAHTYVVRGCGNVMFHISFVVSVIVGIIGYPISWLLFPRFRWQRNEIYSMTISTPIREEIVYRLMLYHFWQWMIQRAARKSQMDSDRTLKGHSKKYRSRVMELLEHKYSFRVVSSLIFGFTHIGHYRGLFYSNEIVLQKISILKGMLHAVSTFFSSFFIFTPLFETRGVMAAIGAHSAWNLICVLPGANGILGILKRLAFFWQLKVFFYNPDDDDDDMSTLVQKLTPRYPSRVE